jgi:hypothetical protein
VASFGCAARRNPRQARRGTLVQFDLGLISATGTASPAERRSVAIRRPACTAGRTALACSPIAATVRSMSALSSASPQ